MLVVIYCQCLMRSDRLKYLQKNVFFPASKCILTFSNQSDQFKVFKGSHNLKHRKNCETAQFKVWRGTRMTPRKQQKMEYLSNRSTKMESDFCVWSVFGINQHMKKEKQYYVMFFPVSLNWPIGIELFSWGHSRSPYIMNAKYYFTSHTFM